MIEQFKFHVIYLKSLTPLVNGLFLSEGKLLTQFSCFVILVMVPCLHIHALKTYQGEWSLISQHKVYANSFPDKYFVTLVNVLPD